MVLFQTAQLRVENSTLQKKLSAAVQFAKKFEDQNKNLVKQVDRLTEELKGNKNARKPVTTVDECASSQVTTCASSCEMVNCILNCIMDHFQTIGFTLHALLVLKVKHGNNSTEFAVLQVGGRLSVDPSLMRDGNMNDVASTPSMSPKSTGWPSGTSPTENEGETDAVSNGNAAEVSPVRKSLSACRMGSKKRSHDQSEAPATYGGSHTTSIGNHMGSGSLGYLALQSSRSRPTSPPIGICGGTTNFLEPISRFFSHEDCYPLGLDPTLKDDNNLDCLEADRWLEFADCFM